ncbi:MAG TPA: hypothetical protein VN577_10415 [Terriglobales bacterium]|nr:hypothetical protein [Terriglobales bacterium]
MKNSKSLQELARVHLALVGMLDCIVISPVTRSHIERLCEEIEQEMIHLHNTEPQTESELEGTADLATDTK